MFKKETYEIRWSCRNSEALENVCRWFMEYGSKSSHLEMDENGKTWYVVYVNARTHTTVKLFEKLVRWIIKLEEKHLEVE